MKKGEHLYDGEGCNNGKLPSLETKINNNKNNNKNNNNNDNNNLT